MKWYDSKDLKPNKVMKFKLNHHGYGKRYAQNKKGRKQ